MNIDLRLIEKSLLTGQWDAAITQNHTAALAKDVVDGEFRGSLTSLYAQEVFKVQPTADLDQPFEFNALFDFSTAMQEDEEEKELVRLTLSVACLHAFVQANWTGPDLDVKPLDVIVLHPKIINSVTNGTFDTKAITELAYGGEPAYHLSRSPTFLRLAQLLLDYPYQRIQSAPWWRLRTALVHQQILDDFVALPDVVLSSLDPLTQAIASHPDMAGRLLLEKGLLEHHFNHDKSAADYFIQAARATGLRYELTGALGKRTKFQQTDLSQLVLLAESRAREDISEECKAAESSAWNNSEKDSSNTHEANVPETLALNDDTLLEQTEFTSSTPSPSDSLFSHVNPSMQPPLHPLDQCILLSLCLNVRNSSPSHGLTNEQMSPYVARVISHPRNWSIHTMALLLRSRLESSRTRTVERSTLQLQALVDQMPTADSTTSERLLYFHSIPLPSKWEMERELALRFLSLGVVKSALEIFERLQMWEEVVKCWQSMERHDKAITIVQDLLDGRKSEADTVISRGKVASSTHRQNLDIAREAKLWCLLGDLEPENASKHYKHAWLISKETSGRAMRSLGGYHFAQGDFAQAITCLRRAVTINPLLSRSWFILGCAYVREENWEGAKEAFGRCVTIDDEDGESWNNLASVYLRMDSADAEVNEDSATKPASNEMLAFQALKQGRKSSYDNWRMWSNYMIVCMNVGELSEACRALSRIVEERGTKVGAECVDDDVLERLVDAVTRAPANPGDAVERAGTAQNAARNPNEGHGLLKRVTDLFDHTILPRISSTRIFRAYGRLLTWQSRWEDALKAHLDGYRCSTAGKIGKGETDVAKWREAIDEVEDIVDVLKNFGPRVEGFTWQFQARSIVRTFMGRSRDFEDEPEWGRLDELMDELRSEE